MLFPESLSVFWKKKQPAPLVELITRSRSEGLNLYCISGYRSYRRQKELFTGDSYVALRAPVSIRAVLRWTCPVLQYKWS